MKKQVLITLIAVIALATFGYEGILSIGQREAECNELLLQNIEALTDPESCQPMLPEIMWQAHHGVCYRLALENGITGYVPTGQIYGYSVAALSGSPEKHEHDCTFYCPHAN